MILELGDGKGNLEYYSVPRLVHIETTYACNANCMFCYNPNKNTSINYKKIDKIVKEVKKARIPHVYLIGGEPSLLGTEKINEYINTLANTSSLTIVTNGLIYLESLSKKLACIGVPIHGDKETHEKLNRKKGSYEKTISTIKRYVKDGFDVRCIPVLTSMNYDQMYNIIKTASELGMESVFIDKFESGGKGSKLAERLSPTEEQFSIALDQIIKAKRELGIPIGFGTAIPYCVDPRLIRNNLQANCGAGTWFAAIDPEGNVRMCNQSEKVCGNVLEESMEKIWNKKELEEFRSLDWVTKPCKDCELLYECLCGCKVDTNYPGEFCVDYAVRSYDEPPNKVDKSTIRKFKERGESETSYPEKYRRWKRNRYLKLNDYHEEDLMVTRYHTTKLGKLAKKLVKFILDKEIILENEVLDKFSDRVQKEKLRKTLSKFEKAGALDKFETQQSL